MQNFKLTLASPVATSFRATKAANSLDIDSEKKSVHHFEVQADLTTPFNIGLIVGASGSGKTTLFKIISTIFALQDGEISVGGRSLRQFPTPVRKKIGVLFFN